MDHPYWGQFQVRQIPAWGMGQVGLPALGQPIGQPVSRQFGYGQVFLQRNTFFLMYRLPTRASR
jgi:hypothetical protein